MHARTKKWRYLYSARWKQNPVVRKHNGDNGWRWHSSDHDWCCSETTWLRIFVFAHRDAYYIIQHVLPLKKTVCLHTISTIEKSYIFQTIILRHLSNRWHHASIIGSHLEKICKFAHDFRCTKRRFRDLCIRQLKLAIDPIPFVEVPRSLCYFCRQMTNVMMARGRYAPVMSHNAIHCRLMFWPYLITSPLSSIMTFLEVHASPSVCRTSSQVGTRDVKWARLARVFFLFCF